MGLKRVTLPGYGGTPVTILSGSDDTGKEPSMGGLNKVTLPGYGGTPVTIWSGRDDTTAKEPSPQDAAFVQAVYQILGMRNG